ncbi:MAG: YitT family protein, partial [Thermicanus sp.]|nr:YitT family protein [Thermicanus sp.]
SIYATGRVIDTLYTRHHKLTLMIITTKGEEMREMLLRHIVRGITMLDGEGAFTREKKKVLFTVISRYELPLIKPYILEVDPKAFVDITQTMEVIGAFRRE